MPNTTFASTLSMATPGLPGWTHAPDRATSTRSAARRGLRERIGGLLGGRGRTEAAAAATEEAARPHRAVVDRRVVGRVRAAQRQAGHDGDGAQRRRLGARETAAQRTAELGRGC